MKLLNREAFLALPPGTLYAKGKPQYFGELSVKGDSLGGDWVCLGVVWAEGMGADSDPGIWDTMLEAGESFPAAGIVWPGWRVRQ